MKATHNISYGVYVLTANDEKMNGCVINTLVQVTTTPNRVAFTVNKSNHTTKQIEKTNKCNVSILTEKTNFELIKLFGFSSGSDLNKFENFKNFEISKNGIPYLTQNTNAYLSLSVFDKKDLGTHIMFFADVDEEVVLNEEASLTYAFYQNKIKPRKEVSKVCYVCSVCGFVYEGDVLPEDYICPLCKHDASVFVKQGEQSEQQPQTASKKYVCPVCGYTYEGDNPPKQCPICGVEMQEQK